MWKSNHTNLCPSVLNKLVSECVEQNLCPSVLKQHCKISHTTAVRYPHSRHFNVTVVVAGSSRRRRDAADGGTTRDQRRRCRRRRWGRRRRSFVRHRRHRPRRAGDPPPPLTAVGSVDCPHSAMISPPGIVVLGLAVGDETSCSPRRDPEIPRDRTRCPTSLHRNSSSAAAPSPQQRQRPSSPPVPSPPPPLPPPPFF